MSAAERDTQRQVIPRWRDLVSTIAHRELEPVRQLDSVSFLPSDEDREGLHQREREFEDHGSLSFAADLVSASLVLGPTPRTVAAARVMVDDPRTPEMARLTAASVLHQAEGSPEPDNDVDAADQAARRRAIRDLRGRLHSNPRNAIKWAELARHYTTEGHARKAINAMRLALAMAPADRFILRGAVRLWVHLREPDVAVDVLKAARSVVVTDPWLLASDIAAAATAGRTSRNIRTARQMVTQGRHTPFAMSELISALATLELVAGQSRRARKLFRSALADPNENSIAQAEWASQHLTGLDIDADQIEKSAEARARDQSVGDDVEGTLGSTWEWLIDQPFSAEPAIFGSYHASMWQRFDEGARFAKEGLRANPRDWLLLNNRAFCLACMDQWADAERLIREAEHLAPTEEQPTVMATQGLIRFRAGDVAAGRDLYEQAIAQLDDRAQRIRAELMLTSELVRAGDPTAPQAAQRIIDQIVGSSNRDLMIWIAFLPRQARL